MTITKSDDCSEINVSTTLYDDTNQSTTLVITRNCTTVYDAVNVDSNDFTVEISYFIIDGTDVYDEGEVIEDGVYEFVITAVDSDGNTITESKCIFNNCSTSCDLLSTMREAVSGDDDSFVKMMAFSALTVAENCTNCACSDLCALYNTATDETCVEDAQPCGCS